MLVLRKLESIAKSSDRNEQRKRHTQKEARAELDKLHMIIQGTIGKKKVYSVERAGSMLGPTASVTISAAIT